ncbi:MAG: glycosyltransferase [Chloroflexia bacterium]|nr:glycosyltransferase [Chloroflexia bacterium]
MRTIVFHRKYRRFHGGHLKVWHYFNHVLATPGFDARVIFDAGSSWDSSNPWREARDRVIDADDTTRPDALFVAGRDWQRLDALGLLDRGIPILNLIQHVRHAEEWSIQARYLDRRAIRLCVSPEVAAAVVAAGSQGPTVVIPNGVDVPLDAQAHLQRPVDLLIAGLKQPGLASRAAADLAQPGRAIEPLIDHVPRDRFLAAMGRSRVTLFLPNEEEGFYLPALEGMALGTLVVCPDCVGNRSFVLPGVNALRPDYKADDVIVAARQALSLPEDEARTLRDNAYQTARDHSPAAEREAFSAVLADLDSLWNSA